MSNKILYGVVFWIIEGLKLIGGGRDVVLYLAGGIVVLYFVEGFVVL